MTPNYGYDPSDPRAQQHGQGQRQPPRPPQQQQGRQGPSQPPQQPPQQPPRQSQQPGQQGMTQGPGHQAGGPPGAQPQQMPPGAGMGSPQGAGQSQPQPPMGGGMQPGGPGQMQQPGQPGMAQQRQQVVLEPITVEDVVTEDVVTVKPDTPIRTVVAQMAENDVGSVVVVEDDEPAGIVTDRKVALALEDSPDITQRNVDELTQDDVITADPSMTIFDVLQVMSDNEIRRIPVVDDNGELQGIVSLDDIIVLIGGELGQVADTVKSQVERL